MWLYIRDHIYSWCKNYQLGVNTETQCNHQIVLPKGRSFTASEEPRLQFCWMQFFHCKLRNQGCRFTRDSTGAVVSRYFPHPTLSLASEQTWKDPRGTNVEMRRVDLSNWAFRTSPKFTTGVKYQFHDGPFDQIRDPEIPFTLHPIP